MSDKGRRVGKIAAAGVISGFFNGLFGSGGGVVAVMFLRSLIGDEKKAHASATLMIAVMSAVSLIFYCSYGHVSLPDGMRFVPGGVVGAVGGTFLLRKLRSDVLRRIFGIVLVLSGGVMLLS